MSPTTYDELFTREAIERAVKDARLKRARKGLLGSDGITRGEFLCGLSVEERAGQVWRLVVERAPLSPLFRVNIPKGFGKEGTRPISYPTNTDAVRLALLGDWLGQHAEEILSPVAIGYRLEVSMPGKIREAVSLARQRRLYVVIVADVKGFFDNIAWKHLERVIDNLPTDQGVKAMLRSAVRARVIDRDTGKQVERTAGTPQGLSVSPSLANLVLHPIDLQLQRAVASSGGIVRRYADDIAIFLPGHKAAEKAQAVLEAQLGQLGLQVNVGTGEVINLQAKGASACWLGVELHLHRGVMAVRVPEKSLRGKAAELRAKVEKGLLSPEELEQRLLALRGFYSQLVRAEEASRSVMIVNALVQMDKGESEVNTNK